MKKLLLLLALFSSSVYAERTMIIESSCRSIDEMQLALSSYEESVIIAGDAAIRILNNNGDVLLVDSVLKLYLNSKTFSYSITAEFPLDDTSCLIMVGDKFSPYIGKPQT